MTTCPKCKHVFDEPTTGSKYPWKITFENGADQNNGNAAVLFREQVDGDVLAVTVNGEAAREGRPYKGAPVFLLSKHGSEYKLPLKFVIKTKEGKTYTAQSGSSSGGGGTGGSTGKYKNKAEYKSYGIRNKRQAWRIDKRGDSLGPGPVKFTFSSGKTFTVKSTAKNCRDQESTCSRNSKSPMYGFVFKPGNGVPNGEGDSDIGTSHKGIYLQAPHGDNSQTVIMEW